MADKHSENFSAHYKVSCQKNWKERAGWQCASTDKRLEIVRLNATFTEKFLKQSPLNCEPDAKQIGKRIETNDGYISVDQAANAIGLL